MRQRAMNWSVWKRTFVPIENHIDPSQGTQFETYGEELQFIKDQDTHNVWTLVDGDNGEQVIVNGFHLVNRIVYYITENPWTDQQDNDGLWVKAD